MDCYNKNDIEKEKNEVEKEEVIRTSQVMYEDDYGNYRYGGGFWSGFGDQ